MRIQIEIPDDAASCRDYQKALNDAAQGYILNGESARAALLQPLIVLVSLGIKRITFPGDSDAR